MAILSPTDTRIENARWAAKRFRTGRKAGLSDPEIARQCLEERYREYRLKPDEAELLRLRFLQVQDVFDVCHLIGELENLSHLSAVDRHTIMVGDRSIQEDVFAAMDTELTKQGFRRGAAAANSKMRGILLAGGCAALVGALVWNFWPVAPKVSAVPAKVAAVAAAAVPNVPTANGGIPPELPGWYQRLQEERVHLDVANPVAVELFNRHAAEYHAALQRAKAAAGTQRSTAASGR